jgi:hypothetical protein
MESKRTDAVFGSSKSKIILPTFGQNGIGIYF